MFFDKSWSEVTDDEIDALADELARTKGGWVFHRKLDRNEMTLAMKCKVLPPAVMADWVRRNS